MSKTFPPWITSTTSIEALHIGALARIKGEETPDVDRLNLPTTTMGKLVDEAYVEQIS